MKPALIRPRLQVAPLVASSFRMSPRSPTSPSPYRASTKAILIPTSCTAVPSLSLTSFIALSSLPPSEGSSHPRNPSHPSPSTSFTRQPIYHHGAHRIKASRCGPSAGHRFEITFQTCAVAAHQLTRPFTNGLPYEIEGDLNQMTLNRFWHGERREVSSGWQRPWAVGAPEQARARFDFLPRRSSKPRSRMN